MRCVIYCREHCPNGIILQKFVTLVDCVSRYHQNIHSELLSLQPSAQAFGTLTGTMWSLEKLPLLPGSICFSYRVHWLGFQPMHVATKLTIFYAPRRTLLFYQFFSTTHCLREIWWTRRKNGRSIVVSVSSSSWSHYYHNPTAVIISMHFLQRKLKVNLPCVYLLKYQYMKTEGEGSYTKN
jgi:hypothetical protein